ncbi:GAF domain-containing protein [Calothrix sp. FACHB-1219]|uniref:GAF domain-containing protein n=1 Tax=unclassified Calothrix TaxID=2619626 RepID=UPI0016824956|nr:MULTISPECIES: GAF domain-containing protein [unclassified Calothrix]MBD2204519.1 GAF domain-containing protein [Calothrix sp. FACHB-168]MBD2219317.1 GAF domain-containing protein [Calothrix sp. FACHB-1219]
MTISYNKSPKATQVIGNIENENGSANVANIVTDQLSTLNAIEEEFRNWRQQLQCITASLRQAPDMEALLKLAVVQIREKVSSDRVLIYQFKTADSGTVLAESIALGWTPTIEETLPILTFGAYTSQDYLEPLVINDITEIKVTPYQQQLLDKFQVKASLSLPIIVEEQIWGLLVVNNCAAPRQWQELEITLISQITTEIAYRIQNVVSQTQNQQELIAQKTITKVIDRILHLSSIDKVFQITTQEVRQFIRCDRVSLYRFLPNWSGEFIAESVGNTWGKLVDANVKTVWEDTHLQDTKGGRYAKGETLAINDVTRAGHSQCHVDILDQFGIKAYIVVPVLSGQKLWGLLAAYQHSGTREWQPWEINFLKDIGAQFGVAISHADNLQQAAIKNKQLAQILEQEKTVSKIANRIRNFSAKEDTDSLFRITTQEVRQAIQCDRVAIYQFNDDWGGEFIAESVISGLNRFVSPEMKLAWHDTYLQETKGGRYATGENSIINDVEQVSILVQNDISQSLFAPCHLEMYHQLEIKGFIIVPIFVREKLWGLLAAYQHSAVREWQPWEGNFLRELGWQIGYAISKADSLVQAQVQNQQLTQIVEKEKTVTKIANRIYQSLDAENILRITTQEVRQALQCDRVVVYEFNSHWGGEFIAESVVFGLTKFVTPETKLTWYDTCLQETQGGRYQKGEHSVANDVSKAGFSACHVEMYEELEIKAFIIVPIFFRDKLWGLLAAYQQSAPREWHSWEINFLTQVGLQLSITKSQIEYFDQVKVKSETLARITEQEKAFSRLVDRIRQSLDMREIFETSTLDLRQLLKCDRTVIYRFKPDWSGEFIAESVDRGWVTLVGPDKKTVWKDTRVQECAYIGKYQKGDIFYTHDIYTAGHSPCHIETLEKYNVRAYATVPIFFGDQLWGLLAVYQNSGPRVWEESEISLLKRITDQLGLALKQTDYLQQAQTKSTELAEVAAREKAAKELLQQRSIQLLTALRPALNGNLTVRAPITEDELGTIADAYNNTLQALRQIVIQVQTAAQQVAHTSDTSEASLAGLTNLASKQTQEMAIALNDIQQMVDSTKAVVSNAELVQLAVKQANQTVESGDSAMNLTVHAIQGIRETVAQTSKKIKRLSESSQKISKVVNLISNFATQTNVLALNAAIEATRAGEYGKGFAVVADEVRSLSRQSAAATIEIEKLVQEIQADTGEVAVAMDIGIQQVVEGTNLVNDARQNLNAIVSATAEISQLIERITAATQKQMDQSVKVTTSMKDVAQISHQTVDESNEIAVVFQKLSAMAKELLATASKFKVN